VTALSFPLVGTRVRIKSYPGAKYNDRTGTVMDYPPEDSELWFQEGFPPYPVHVLMDDEVVGGVTLRGQHVWFMATVVEVIG
jgi:hypothetical protein